MSKMPSKLSMVLGRGRSGTTLLAKLLDSSRIVRYRHEPDTTLINNTIPYLPKPEEYIENRQKTIAYVEQMIKNQTSKTVSSRPIFEKVYRTDLDRKLHVMSIYMAGGLEKAGIPIKVPDFSSNNCEPVYLIKSVSSLCRAGLFLRSMPDIKIMHLIRHPCAVISSRRRGFKQGKMPDRLFIHSVARMNEATSYPFTLDEVLAWPWEKQAAYEWMIHNSAVYEELKGEPNYRIVRYEDLCTNLRDTTKNLAEFIDVEFDDQMQKFVDGLLSVSDDKNAYFNVLKNPKQSLYRYKTELSEVEQQQIEAVVSLSAVGRLALAPVSDGRDTAASAASVAP